MTRPKKSRQSVSTFGPQLLTILLRGARESVSIPCPDQRTMKWLQARIHALRGAMERENHPQYALVCRARTSRSWNTEAGKDVDCVLTIQPQDHQFAAIFDAAGIHADPHHTDLLNDVAGDAPSFDLDAEVSTAHDPYAKFK